MNISIGSLQKNNTVKIMGIMPCKHLSIESAMKNSDVRSSIECFARVHNIEKVILFDGYFEVGSVLEEC